MSTRADDDGPVEILASRFLLHPRDYDRSVAFYRDTLGASSAPAPAAASSSSWAEASSS